MAWSTVNWYSLGFNIATKQSYFYYGLDGDNTAYQVFVTAPQLTALADMFRNEGPIRFSSDGHYFVSNQEHLAHSQVVRISENEHSASGGAAASG